MKEREGRMIRRVQLKIIPLKDSKIKIFSISLEGEDIEVEERKICSRKILNLSFKKFLEALEGKEVIEGEKEGEAITDNKRPKVLPSKLISTSLRLSMELQR